MVVFLNSNTHTLQIMILKHSIENKKKNQDEWHGKNVNKNHLLGDKACKVQCRLDYF